MTHLRIGHLIGELSIWYFFKIIKKNDFKEIWYVAKNSCNPYWVKKIGQKINISDKFIKKIFYDLFIRFGVQELLIKPPKHVERDINGLVYKNDNIINFSQKEIDYGNKLLKEINIQKEDKIVCICIRDNYFFKKYTRTLAWQNYEYKNSDIEKYDKAVKYLNGKNIKVVRMGVGSENRWSLVGLNNIDYSISKIRSGFLDFFLVNKSKFSILNGTGFYWIPYIQKKPLVMTDLIPIGNINSYVPNNLTIFKHIYSEEKKRNLNLNEMLSQKFNFIVGNKNFKQKGLKPIDNSKEEIYEVVKEMNERLDGNFNKENNLKQKNFWDLYPKIIENHHVKERHGEINARIGASFLDKYL